MPEQPTLGGPHLAVAVLRERALEEKAGVASHIWIIERITISGPSPAMHRTVLTPMLVLGFKAGCFAAKETPKYDPCYPPVEPGRR